jgi:PAS domain S-box-containing protein
MAGAPVTLVVIDDAPEVRLFVKAQLRRSGQFMVVGEGGTGLDAIDLVRMHRPEVLLLDISMPIMDGLEALPQIRATSPETRVVMYTGFDSHGLAERAKQLGAAAFLEKSAGAKPLADELSRLLRIDAGVSSGSGAPGSGAPGSGASAAVSRTEQAAGDAHRSRPEPMDERFLDEHIERFREVFEAAAIGMGTMTLAGRIVRANHQLAEIFGLSPAEVVGRPYAALASDEEVVTEAVMRAADSELTQFEHTARHQPDRRMMVSISTVRDEAHRPLYYFIQVQDVTAQRAAEEELRQSEERFRLLVEAVEDYAIFMLDPGGHVVSWNAGAQRINGYRSDEILGQHFRVFYPREKQESRHPEHELRIAIREGHYEEEGWRVRKDGTQFWATVLITAVRNQAGEHVGFAKVTRDITERRRVASERERTMAALGVANRELEKANVELVRGAEQQAQFLAVTAHELRTPLSVILGSADSLAEHLREMDDEERVETVQAMRSSAARLRRLLADLLAAARLEAGVMRLETRPVDLVTVLDEVAISVQALHPEADIVVAADHGVWADADPDRLSQMIENLVVNAIRYGAGPIILKAAQCDANQVCVEVRDHGRGVAATQQPLLFERFATGTKAGTGLGLFIVRELARAHGGDARYESANPGARFIVTLPTLPPVRAARSPESESRLTTPR